MVMSHGSRHVRLMSQMMRARPNVILSVIWLADKISTAQTRGYLRCTAHLWLLCCKAMSLSVMNLKGTDDGVLNSLRVSCGQLFVSERLFSFRSLAKHASSTCCFDFLKAREVYVR